METSLRAPMENARETKPKNMTTAPVFVNN